MSSLLSSSACDQKDSRADDEGCADRVQKCGAASACVRKLSAGVVFNINFVGFILFGSDRNRFSLSQFVITGRSLYLFQVVSAGLKTANVDTVCTGDLDLNILG